MTDDRRMTTERFFGGRSNRLRYLHQFLKFVEEEDPSFEECIRWIREKGYGESRDVIKRNIRFLTTCRILARAGNKVKLGEWGQRYVESRNPVDLYAGLVSGVKGFETLLEGLDEGPMSDEELADRLRPEFPEYKLPVEVVQGHRAWLQVLGLLSHEGDQNYITTLGQEVLNGAMSAPDEELIPREPDTSGRVYEASTSQVRVSQEFKNRVIEQYGGRCLLTEISHPRLVTLAHVLPRSDYVHLAEDPRNVFVVNWTHHAAFDAGLFTFDSHYRIRVAPDFNPWDPWLRETIAKREGNPVELPADVELSTTHLETRNQTLEWWPSD